MELGPHAEEVLEIVELVESGVIFRDPRPPSDPALIIIHDMAEAQNYRFTDPDPRYGGRWEWREVLDFAGDPDLRDEIHEKDYDMLYSSSGLFHNLVDDLVNLMEERINVALDRQLGNKYTQDDISSIYCNFDYILSLRATFGRTLPFIERLISIYRLGGHPCGWSGPCPGGCLVAYFPPRDERRGG